MEGKWATKSNQYFQARFIAERCAAIYKVVNELFNGVLLFPTASETLLLSLLCPHSSESCQSHRQGDKCVWIFLVTFGNHHLMSFISSLHVDTNDVPSHLQGAISDCIEGHKMHQDEQVQNALFYLRQLLEEGIGVCTTCVYQFVGRESLDPEDEIYSYFLMDGICLGVRIETHVAHSFLPMLILTAHHSLSLLETLKERGVCSIILIIFRCLLGVVVDPMM